MEMGHGDAAAAMWIFRGDESRRHRGFCAETSRGAAKRRGHSVETGARLRYAPVDTGDLDDDCFDDSDLFDEDLNDNAL